VFIKAHRDSFCVAVMCDVFGVSRSGYYDWFDRAVSRRDQDNQCLDVEIKAVYKEHKQRYGAPRIAKALQSQGRACSHTRVARRMKSMNIRGLAKKKFKVTTDSNHKKPVYSNVLNRDFSTTALNQKWVGDITYIATEEGWLYLAIIIDLHSRAVIGWSMSPRMQGKLVCDALKMALLKRNFPSSVTVHSDRGSQYCSHDYKNIIKQYKLIGSMSRRGNCWDNAVSESFFHTLKVELVHELCYETREKARQSIFNYIECYYNQKRLHSALDYKAPSAIECAA